MVTLFLPLGNNCLTIAAQGFASCKSLRRFADLAGLAIEANSDAACDLLLTDRQLRRLPEKYYRFSGMPDSPFHICGNNTVILQHDSTLAPWLSGEWPLMIRLAALRKILLSQQIFVMHGALLELSPGKGTVLFGHSGVGKSTAVLRCRMAGSKCRADDMILVYLRDGDLWSAPLPTPSYCREYYRRNLCYPFLPALKVDRLLHLCRGNKHERLVKISRDAWLPPLVHSLSFHYSSILSLLDKDAIHHCGNMILDFAVMLTEKFPMTACETHFSGTDIIKTLTGDVDDYR